MKNLHDSSFPQQELVRISNFLHSSSFGSRFGTVGLGHYIYLNVDECLLASSMPHQRFKLQVLLNYAVIPENVISED